MYISRAFWIAYVLLLGAIGLAYFQVPRLVFLAYLMVPLAYVIINLMREILELETRTILYDDVEPSYKDETKPDTDPRLNSLQSIVPVCNSQHPSRLYMLASVIKTKRFPPQPHDMAHKG